MEAPEPFTPGSLAEFIEFVWWPRITAGREYSTQLGYRSIIQTHFDRFLEMQIQDIRLEVLQPWVSELIRTPVLTRNGAGEVVSSAPRSPKRVRNIYAVMSSILSLARMTGRYPHEDYRLVELPDIPAKVDRRDLNLDLTRALNAAAVGTSMEGPVWIASHLGLRRNEVCGLRVTDIEMNEDAATIRLVNNRQRHGAQERLKNRRKGEAHELRIPRSWGEKILSFAPEGAIYICHDEHGKPINPNRITKSMADLCRRAGVPQTEFRELRAAVRSNLQAAGAPEVMIMAILNHRSLEISRRYQDRRLDDESELLAKLGDE